MIQCTLSGPSVRSYGCHPKGGTSKLPKHMNDLALTNSQDSLFQMLSLGGLVVVRPWLPFKIELLRPPLKLVSSVLPFSNPVCCKTNADLLPSSISLTVCSVLGRCSRGSARLIRTSSGRVPRRFGRQGTLSGLGASLKCRLPKQVALRPVL